jgi:hypothetical protein
MNVPPPLLASGPSAGSPESAALQPPSSTRLRTLATMAPLGFTQSPPVLLAMIVLRNVSALLVSRRPPPFVPVPMLPERVLFSSVSAFSLRIPPPLGPVLPESVLFNTKSVPGAALAMPPPAELAVLL